MMKNKVLLLLLLPDNNNDKAKDKAKAKFAQFVKYFSGLIIHQAWEGIVKVADDDQKRSGDGWLWWLERKVSCIGLAISAGFFFIGRQKNIMGFVFY